MRLREAPGIGRHDCTKQHKQTAVQIVCYTHFEQMSSPKTSIVSRLHFPAWCAVIHHEPVPYLRKNRRRQRRLARGQAAELLRASRPLRFCPTADAFRKHCATRLPKTTIAGDAKDIAIHCQYNRLRKQKIRKKSDSNARKVSYRTLATHIIHKAGFSESSAHTGAVTLIQRFGRALTKSPGAILNSRRLAPKG
jgi:hypothetical protein